VTLLWAALFVLSLGMQYVSFAAPATTSAAATAASLDQCANGSAGSVRLDCTSAQWQNGNLNENDSQFAEGDSVPFRALITVPTGGDHDIWIQFDTTKSSTHAYDYLTGWDASEGGDPTAGTSVPGASPSALAIATPSDAFCSSGFSTPPSIVPGSFKLYGGGSLTGMAYTNPDGSSGIPSTCSGDQSVTVRVSFTTAAGGDLVLAWGGHIGSERNWGLGNGAAAISGSPYHQRILQVDTTEIGSQDRSLKASAVLVPPTIETQVSAADVPVGQSITDSVTVSGSVGTPGGSVVFRLCGPLADATGCATGGTQVGTAKALSGEGGTATATSDPTGGSLAAGTYCFRADYTPGAGSQYLAGSHTNTSTECFDILSARIGVTKTADAGSVAAGDQIGFTVTLSNSGTGTASGLAFTDALPGGPGVDWSISPASAGWSIGGSAPDQSLVYSPPSLAAGSSTSVHVASGTTVDSCATYDNTASVTTTNDGSAEASASTVVVCETVGQSSLTIAKSNDAPIVSIDLGDGTTADLPTANEGATVTFTLDYTLGGNPVSDAYITDVLPAGQTYVTDSASSSDEFSFTSYDSTTRTLRWDAATATKSGTVSYQVTIDTGAGDLAQPLVNVATIQSAQTDPATAQSDVFVPIPPLAVTPPPTDTLGPTQAPGNPGFTLMLTLLLLAGLALGIGFITPVPERVRRRDDRR
jgi:uncharacterized repeat protein (TIGR01451 family)